MHALLFHNQMVDGSVIGNTSIGTSASKHACHQRMAKHQEVNCLATIAKKA